MVRHRRFALLLALAFAGCDSSAPADAAVDAGRCSSDEECSDPQPFCAPVRCLPEDPGADARGCVALGSPCAEGEICVEADDRCSSDPCAIADADGDGHDALECGGDDCDDADASRFAGAVEVCDAEGHDEDCDPTTLGATDADGDGAISAACCNGATCGGDCNDGDPLVGPLQREACNGRDDDCDGTIDMAERSLCPGGMCSSARCTFTAWDRTFGGDNVDSASVVTIDDEGNVYVAVVALSPMDLGTGTITPNGQDVLIVRYSPEGIFQWFTSWLVLPGSQFVPHGLEVTPGGVVYVTFPIQLSLDLGSGERAMYSTLLVALSAHDGSYLWDRVVSTTLGDVVALETVGEDVVAIARQKVERYRSDGTLAWSADYAGSTDVARFVRGDPTRRGDSIYVMGLRPGTDAHFVGEVSIADGSLGRTVPLDGPLWLQGMGLGTDGGIYVSGSASGAFTVGGAPVAAPPASGGEGMLLALSPDGAPRWVRYFGTLADNRAIAVDTRDRITLGGTFFGAGSVNFGGGSRPVTGQSGWIVQYTSTNVHVWDTLFGTVGESSTLDIAVGPGDTTAVVGGFTGSADFGSGPRVSYEWDGSEPFADAFVARLAD